MTISQTVKNELLSNLKEMQPCCKVAFLSAVFRSAGSLVINSKGYGVVVSGENKQLISFVSRTIEEMFGVDCPIKNSPNHIKNNNIYSVTIKDKTVLKETGILAEKDGFTSLVTDIDQYIVAQDCCLRYYATGLFVGCGTLTLPSYDNEKQKNNAGYHVEFFLNSPNVAQSLVKLLAERSLKFKIAPRSEGTVVYAKDSATISDFLAYLGASRAVLDLQTLLIVKDYRNNANRQSNCITANIGKSVSAAEKQIADIEYVINQKGWDYFSEQLKTVAKARLDNPSANMVEIADICGNDLTKSGVAHRFRKIAQIAKKLGKTE